MRSGTAHPLRPLLARIVSSATLALGLALPGPAARAGEPPSTEARADGSDSGGAGSSEGVSELDADFLTVVPSPGLPETGSAAHIGGRELTLMRGRTAADSLRLVPGLVLVQRGTEGKGFQFFMRGFDALHGADLEVTVDGIPVNAPSNVHGQGYVDLGFLLPEVVIGIDVTKGPFATAQGQFAVAGSADFRLGVPESRRGIDVEYEIGTTNRHRIRTVYAPGGPSEEDSDLPATSRDRRTFVAAEAMHDSGFGENRRNERLGFIGALEVFDDARGRLDLTTAAAFTAFRLPSPVPARDIEAGVIGLYDAEDGEGRGEASRLLAAARWIRHSGAHDVRVSSWATGWRLDLLENTTGFLIDPLNGDRQQQHEDAFEVGADARHLWQLHPIVALESGLGLRSIYVDQTEQHVGQGLEPLELRRSLTGWQHALDGFTGVRVTPTDALRIDLGVRADVMIADAHNHLDGVSDVGTAFAASPRASLSWYPIPEVGVFAAYGRGVRPPELRAFVKSPAAPAGTLSPSAAALAALTYDGGDTDMTTSDTVEVGLRTSPWPWLRVDVSAFFTAVANEAVFDQTLSHTVALAATTRFGAEFGVALAPLDWIEFHGDVSFVDARFDDTDDLVPGVPRLMGSVSAIFQHPMGLHGAIRFLGIAPRPLAYGETGSAYTSLDVHAGYTWRRFDIGLHMENILGLELEESQANYASRWDRTEAALPAPTIHSIAAPPLLVRVTLGARF